MAASCLLCCTAVSAPVRIEVVDARIEDGDVVLVLNRPHSRDWLRTFREVCDTKAVHERTPDEWRYKGEVGAGALAASVYSGMLRILDVPADPVALRELMLAVRFAVAQTNAAEPSEDPPRADGSLIHVVKEVFGAGVYGPPNDRQ